MREYKSKYSYKEQIENPEVTELIQVLKSEDFKNKLQRRKMIKLLVNLFHLDNEKEVRKFFRLLGDACTNIGEELLKDENIEDNVVDELKIK
jgi:cell division ATPase FtsA